MFTRVTIKFDGRHYDYPIGELDLDVEHLVDVDIRTALSQRIAMDLSAEQGTEPADVMPVLTDFVIDPTEKERLSGQCDNKEVLSLRPVAGYGSQGYSDDPNVVR